MVTILHKIKSRITHVGLMTTLLHSGIYFLLLTSAFLAEPLSAQSFILLMASFNLGKLLDLIPHSYVGVFLEKRSFLGRKFLLLILVPISIILTYLGISLIQYFYSPSVDLPALMYLKLTVIVCFSSSNILFSNILDYSDNTDRRLLHYFVSIVIGVVLAVISFFFSFSSLLFLVNYLLWQTAIFFIMNFRYVYISYTVKNETINIAPLKRLFVKYYVPYFSGHFSNLAIDSLSKVFIGNHSNINLFTYEVLLKAVGITNVAYSAIINAEYRKHIDNHYHNFFRGTLILIRRLSLLNITSFAVLCIYFAALSVFDIDILILCIIFYSAGIVNSLAYYVLFFKSLKASKSAYTISYLCAPFISYFIIRFGQFDHAFYTPFVWYIVGITGSVLLLIKRRAE